MFIHESVVFKKWNVKKMPSRFSNKKMCYVQIIYILGDSVCYFKK